MNISAAYAANTVGIYSNPNGGSQASYGDGFSANRWYFFRMVLHSQQHKCKSTINGSLVLTRTFNLITSTGAFTIGTDGK